MKKQFICFNLIFILFFILSCKKQENIVSITLNEKEQKLIGSWNVNTPKTNEMGVWEFKNNGTILTKTEAMTFEGYFKIKNDTLILTFTMREITFKISEFSDEKIILKSKLNEIEIDTVLNKIKAQK